MCVSFKWGRNVFTWSLGWEQNGRGSGQCTISWIVGHFIELRNLSWRASEPVEGFGLSCCGCWTIFTSQHLRKNTHRSRFQEM